jgi:DNA-binding NarL/FixJ family response regulator
MGIRILIADGQDMFREVLRYSLESSTDFDVVGETGDGDQILAMAAKLKPDIILIDLNLRKRSGLEVVREVAALDGRIYPILLTDRIEKSKIVETLRCGVRGIVGKNESVNLLIKSIRTVMAGEYWLSRSNTNELVGRLRSLTDKVEQSINSRARNLSGKQQQVVELIAAGCSNKDIAQDLSISERTVKYHLTRIFSRLGVANRMQLACITFKNEEDSASTVA